MGAWRESERVSGVGGGAPFVFPGVCTGPAKGEAKRERGGGVRVSARREINAPAASELQVVSE